MEKLDEIHVDFRGLRIQKLHDSHIKQVQKLYELYLLPTYIQRLNLPYTATDHEQIRKYDFIEEILNIDNVKSERYRDHSVVVLDQNDRVVACSFNYLVNEKQFEEEFVMENLRLSQDQSLAHDHRVYLKHQYDIWQGLDFFRKYNLQTVLYQETMIIHPEYRHKGMSGFLMRYTKHIFADQCDAVLNDSQIPMEILIKATHTKNPMPGSISLREIVSYDDFVVHVALFIHDKNRLQHYGNQEDRKDFQLENVQSKL